jgi:hypothetical protein
MQDFVFQTCELERKNAENKKQLASATVDINRFMEHMNPKDYPMLDSGPICQKTDKYIMVILCGIMKLSKEVKNIDLLKDLNYNDILPALWRSLALQSSPA